MNLEESILQWLENCYINIEWTAYTVMDSEDNTEYTAVAAGDDLDKQIDEAANKKKLAEVEMR